MKLTVPIICNKKDTKITSSIFNSADLIDLAGKPDGTEITTADSHILFDLWQASRPARNEHILTFNIKFSDTESLIYPEYLSQQQRHFVLKSVNMRIAH